MSATGRHEGVVSVAFGAAGLVLGALFGVGAGVAILLGEPASRSVVWSHLVDAVGPACTPGTVRGDTGHQERCLGVPVRVLPPGPIRDGDLVGTWMPVDLVAPRFVPDARGRRATRRLYAGEPVHESRLAEGR